MTGVGLRARTAFFVGVHTECQSNNLIVSVGKTCMRNPNMRFLQMMG